MRKKIVGSLSVLIVITAIVILLNMAISVSGANSIPVNVEAEDYELGNGLQLLRFEKEYRLFGDGLYG